MMEKRTRSLAKALSWRVIATGTTMTLVVLATGELKLAAGIGVAEASLKLAFYYMHERAWNMVNTGRVSDGQVNGA